MTRSLPGKALGGDRVNATLDELKGWLGVHNAAVMTVLFLVLGVVLIAKGIPPLVQRNSRHGGIPRAAALDLGHDEGGRRGQLDEPRTDECMDTAGARSSRESAVAKTSSSRSHP